MNQTLIKRINRSYTLGSTRLEFCNTLHTPFVISTFGQAVALGLCVQFFLLQLCLKARFVFQQRLVPLDDNFFQLAWLHLCLRIWNRKDQGIHGMTGIKGRKRDQNLGSDFGNQDRYKPMRPTWDPMWILSGHHELQMQLSHSTRELEKCEPAISLVAAQTRKPLQEGLLARLLLPHEPLLQRLAAGPIQSASMCAHRNQLVPCNCMELVKSISELLALLLLISTRNMLSTSMSTSTSTSMSTPQRVRPTSQ